LVVAPDIDKRCLGVVELNGFAILRRLYCFNKVHFAVTLHGWQIDGAVLKQISAVFSSSLLCQPYKCLVSTHSLLGKPALDLFG